MLWFFEEPPPPLVATWFVYDPFSKSDHAGLNRANFCSIYLMVILRYSFKKWALNKIGRKLMILIDA